MIEIAQRQFHSYYGAVRWQENVDLHCSKTAHIHDGIDLASWVLRASENEILDNLTEDIFVWQRDLCWLAALNTDDSSQTQCFNQACAKLSAFIDEVPRDSVYTYATRAYTNSPRTFTGKAEEEDFVLGLQDASRIFHNCALSLLKMRDPNGTGANTRTMADKVENTLSSIHKNLSEVIQSVSLTTFVDGIEPNFIRRNVLERPYYAPTAAQLPLVLLEALLHGCSASSTLEKHIRFQADYIPRSLRLSVHAALKSEPMLFNDLPYSTSRKIIAHLNRFRKVHMAIAKKAFELQSNPSEKAKQILEDLLYQSEETKKT